MSKHASSTLQEKALVRTEPNPNQRTMSFRRSSLSSTHPKDLELLPTEADPLLSKVANETYGDESNIHLPENRRPSVSESRRFEPLPNQLVDVVRVYWH